MNEVYLHYNEDRSGGEICDGEENSNYPNHEPEYIEFHPTALTSVRDGGFLSEPIEVSFDPKENIGKKVWVVVVRYGDGDTFGHTEGHWTIRGAYLNEEDANKEVDFVKKNEHKPQNTGYLKHWFPWWGYFASFEGIEVHEFILGGSFEDRDEQKDVRYFRH